MNETRSLRSIKGLVLLGLLVAPLFVAIFPNFSGNSALQSTTNIPNENPTAASNIPSDGFGRFWVNNTEFQENNTLYAHVADILHLKIEVGDDIPDGSLTVTFQQVGGARSFSDDLMTADSVSEGDITIDNTLTTSDLGEYRVTLHAGRNFVFHVVISHASPIVTNIVLWDTLYKTTKQSVLDQGIYENYRNTTIYTTMTYQVRSQVLINTAPSSVVMLYDDGTGLTSEVNSSGSYSQGLITCTFPAIVTDATTSKWLPGDYAVRFNISYAGVIEGLAEFTLRILNIPPNITSWGVSPTHLVAPTSTTTQNATILCKVQDPDDDGVYGTTESEINNTRACSGYATSDDVTVSSYAGTEDLSVANDGHFTNFTFLAGAVMRWVDFYVELSTTNVTNIDHANVTIRFNQNSTTSGNSIFQMYHNVSGWVTVGILSGNNAEWWNQTSFSILTAQNAYYMIVNNSNYLHFRVRGFDATNDFSIAFDLVEVQYTHLRPAGIVGALLTVYSPYYRLSGTNKNYSQAPIDVTEWYDDVTHQFVIPVSFQYGIDNGPYTLRLDVYDHGTAPYRAPSDPYTRSTFNTIRTNYGAGWAMSSARVVIGDTDDDYASNYDTGTLPSWGNNPSGMNVTRGDSVTLSVSMSDLSLTGDLSETSPALNSNVSYLAKSTGANNDSMTGYSLEITSGTINNTELDDTYFCTASLGNVTHYYGMNNLHIRFNLGRYYFVGNDEISALTLDITGCIIQGGMPTDLGNAMVQVYNISSGSWANLTTVNRNSEFNQFGTYGAFSESYASASHDIGNWINPSTRDVYFRIQYNETSASQASSFGLNVSLDYVRLTATYDHQKKVVAMLTQDLNTFYWFTMSRTSESSGITYWSTSIPTSQLPAGAYNLVLRTQTIEKGVNYIFAGRFSSTGAMHTTQDWQGTWCKNSTLRVNTSSISVAIASGWNKTVFRGKTADFAVNGTYALSYGAISANSLRIEFRLVGEASVYYVYKGSDAPNFGSGVFNYLEGTWEGNFTFSSTQSQPGLWHFRLWVQADDGAVNATTWQEIYLINAPPHIELDASFPAEFNLWRLKDYASTPMSVTDYDTVFTTGSDVDFLLEATNRSNGNVKVNASIWHVTQVSSAAAPTYPLQGTINVPAGISNQTIFSDFILVANDGQQVSVLRGNSTFNIFNNFPTITASQFLFNGSASPDTKQNRNHDVNVSIQYSDVDDPAWNSITVQEFNVSQGTAETVAAVLSNAQFIYTGGMDNQRNATFHFGRENATGIYTARLVLVDPEGASVIITRTVNATNNNPVATQVRAQQNGGSFVALTTGSTFQVNRSVDSIVFNVTLWDEEDTYQGSQHVSEVWLRLKHSSPVGATAYYPMFLNLTWNSTNAGLEYWAAPSVNFTKENTHFGAGTVQIDVMIRDQDGDNNTGNTVGGVMVDFRVNNSKPYFLGPQVEVPQSIIYTDTWNIAVWCGDWEGVYKIAIYFRGYDANMNLKLNTQEFFTATGISGTNLWDDNGTTGVFICGISRLTSQGGETLASYLGEYQIQKLTVIAAYIYDTDNPALGNSETSYGATWDWLDLENFPLSTTVGELPSPDGFPWLYVIFGVVGAIAAVIVVYAVIYFRKNMTYRRYM